MKPHRLITPDPKVLAVPWADLPRLPALRFRDDNHISKLGIPYPYELDDDGELSRSETCEEHGGYEPVGFTDNPPGKTKYADSGTPLTAGVMFEAPDGNQIWAHFPCPAA